MQTFVHYYPSDGTDVILALRDASRDFRYLPCFMNTGRLFQLLRGYYKGTSKGVSRAERVLAQFAVSSRYFLCRVFL